MSVLEENGKTLLKLLVEHMGTFGALNMGDRRCFVSYKRVHDRLGLQMHGNTIGISLRDQGMANLADWTKEHQHPAITGFIVAEDSGQPGEGYFGLADPAPANIYDWWREQLEAAKTYNWKPFIRDVELLVNEPETGPAGRVQVTMSRPERDTKIANGIKKLHGHKCQLCGSTIELPSGKKYAEAHHIQPLGMPHNGPDIRENIICLCPNHHVELDYGVRKLRREDLHSVDGHDIADVYIDYHNRTFGFI